jgi:hypothetical protein
MKTIQHHNQKPIAARTRPPISWIGCLAVFFASISPSKGATVSIGVDHWGIDGTGVGGAVMPLPSTTDLVNAGSPDLLYFNSTYFSSPSGINDGPAGTSVIEESADQYPALITFSLDIISNPLGYTISSIRTLSGGLTGWVVAGLGDDSRMQYYRVEYSVVGDAGFETLLTVDIRDFDPEGPSTDVGLTWVTLLDIEDELTGVDVIKFTWLDPSPLTGSGSWIHEIDIVGTPVTQVPEPGSALLILGATFLLSRRTRSR